MPGQARADRPARLFLALWPDAAARRRCVAWQRRWRWPPGASVVAPERLHLTLHFIGDVDPARLPELGAGLALPFAPFDIAFGLPRLWRGGLALAVPQAVPEPLLALHAALGDALRRLELPVEARPFRPHLTLARRADGAEPPAEALACGWRVERYALVRSANGYRTVAEFGAAG